MSQKNKDGVNIFYFSGTGNTWWVAEELVRQLKDKGLAAVAHSIEAISSAEAAILIGESALVGFGYPIYGSDLPDPMKNFMAGLPKVSARKTLVFCTQWLWSGDGAAIGASFLKDKGYKVDWGEHFLMPNNVTVSIIRFPYTNDPARLSVVLNRARKRIEHITEKIVSGKSFRRGFNKISFLMGCLQRLPYRGFYHKLQNDIAVDPLTCIDCGECVRLCPAENIFYNGNDYLTRGSCILCLRCYNFCPVTAITYMKRSHLQSRGEPYRGPVENFDPNVLTGTINQ